jgi:hypothetical protein
MDRTDKPREPGVSPGGEQPQPHAGRETQDVSIPAIVKFGIGLAISAVVIHVGVWGLFRVLDARAGKRETPVPPMVAASLKRTPAGPRLEPNPLAPRRAAQARDNAVLASYGWVDKGSGIARIPIERAMQLLVERGLPPAKVATPVVAVTPGAGKRETENGKR